MRRALLPLVLGLLLLGALLARPASADPPTPASLAERLDSPVAEVRRRAWHELDDLDADAAGACLAAWSASPSPWLRAAAHRVRALRAADADIDDLLTGLLDGEASVARAASDALLHAAAADRLGAEPPLPRSRALSGPALRALSLALEARLENGDAESLAWVLRLGEGAVGPVSLVALEGLDGSPARRAALALLARFGGLGGRRGIAAGGPSRWTADFAPWCDAVLAVGEGPGFEEIAAWLDDTVLPTELSEEGFRGRRGRAPWRHPRANMAELIAQFAEGRRVRAASVLREWMETQGGGWWTQARIQVARAFLAVEDPSDDDLVELVGASIPPFNRRARAGGMHDGLAEILRMLGPFAPNSEVLRQEAESALERELPPVHRAWLRFLAEGRDAEGLGQEALDLLCAVPPHPERQRLAAFLLDRLGPPPAAALDAAAGSDDGSLRAWAALHRVRAPGAPGREAAAAALLDPDDRVLLAGALAARVEPPAEARRRLVDIATFGQKLESRRRAVRGLALERDRGSTDADPLEGLAEAALDDRLRWRYEALRGRP